MEEQVEKLKRELWREFTVNCHFYTGTLESMKDRNLLLVSQLCLGVNVLPLVPVHLRESFTTTGLGKQKRDTEGTTLILGL